MPNTWANFCMRKPCGTRYPGKLLRSSPDRQRAGFDSGGKRGRCTMQLHKFYLWLEAFFPDPAGRFLPGEVIIQSYGWSCSNSCPGPRVWTGGAGRVESGSVTDLVIWMETNAAS